MPDKDSLNKAEVASIANYFKSVTAKAMQTSVIRPLISELFKRLTACVQGFDKPNPSANEEIRKLIIANMPKFVYYSSYGNLDSEIYLPHVIENMKRTDLTGMAEAKARTLKVLFEYVKLDPEKY